MMLHFNAIITTKDIASSDTNAITNITVKVAKKVFVEIKSVLLDISNHLEMEKNVNF